MCRSLITCCSERSATHRRGVDVGGGEPNAPQGEATASDGQEQTDYSVAKTTAPLLRDPTYDLSDRDFDVM